MYASPLAAGSRGGTNRTAPRMVIDSLGPVFVAPVVLSCWSPSLRGHFESIVSSIHPRGTATTHVRKPEPASGDGTRGGTNRTAPRMVIDSLGPVFVAPVVLSCWSPLQELSCVSVSACRPFGQRKQTRSNRADQKRANPVRTRMVIDSLGPVFVAPVVLSCWSPLQ
jgi:hypothetical protein